MKAKITSPSGTAFRVAYVTSVHPDFDARIWKYAVTMADRGHAVHLVCPWKVPDGDTRAGVIFHTFAPQPLWRLPFLLAGKLLPLLRQVDVVHFHDINILPLMAAFSMVKPVIYDVHENYPDEMMVRHWVPQPCRRLMYHAVRVGQAALAGVVRNVVYVVPEQQRDFPSVLRSTIVRNYATSQLLERVRSNYRTRPSAVVFTGSNYEANGTFLLLEIARRMRMRRPRLRFILPERWTDPLTRDRALQMIQTRNLDNVVLVPNVRPQEVIEYLNQGTIGISADLRVPQRIKALPTKLFEFMAAGLPIVASDLPNTWRLARETGAILLCRPEEPDTFVDAIELLDRDRDTAYVLGLRAQRKFRERYCWESQAEDLERYYARVLGRLPVKNAQPAVSAAHSA